MANETFTLKSLPMALINLTDGCNSRCITCDIWKSPRRNMEMDLVESLANEFEALGTKYVALSGGEAMQHPQWPAIAKRFKKAGARVILFTNGLLLRKQAKDVIDSIDSVTISLDGANAQTYHDIRGVNAFDLVLEGMRTLADAKIPTRTRTTIQRRNFREMPEIVDVALQNGAKSASFLTVDVKNETAFGARPKLAKPGTPHTQSSTALRVEDLPEFALVLDRLEKSHKKQFKNLEIVESPQKLRKFYDYFEAVNGLKPFSKPPCNGPNISVVIEVDGSLRPCFFLPSGANLGESTLRTAINQTKMQELRQDFDKGTRKECEGCVCPLYVAS